MELTKYAPGRGFMFASEDGEFVKVSDVGIELVAALNEVARLETGVTKAEKEVVKYAMLMDRESDAIKLLEEKSTKLEDSLTREQDRSERRADKYEALLKYNEGAHDGEKKRLEDELKKAEVDKRIFYGMYETQKKKVRALKGEL